jgi:peptide deformylase
MELKIITIEDDIDNVSSVLKNKARQVNFPLSAEDKQIIACMQAILFKADGVGYATTIFFAVVRHISLPVWR